MGVHVELQVDVTCTICLTEWALLFRVEHDNLVLLTLEPLDDQGKDHEVTVRRDHEIVLLLQLSLFDSRAILIIVVSDDDGIGLGLLNTLQINVGLVE